MPEQVLQTTVNSFIRGLITEASPLTFPENASVDELNCVLEKTGVRKRRKGIELETNSSLSTFTTGANDLIFTTSWKNVANTSGTEFLVVQVADTLHFYDKSTAPLSANEKSFTVDLNTFSASNGEDVGTSRISADSINGFLVVVSKAIEPFYIEYNPEADTITTTTFIPRVRDFEWQGDTDEYFEKSPLIASTSDERIYDTVNAGWVNFVPDYTVLDRYKAARGRYPPLTIQWWQGRDQTGSGTGEFRVNWFEKFFGGTTLIGNGHFILDLFEKNRAQALIDDELVTETISLPAETDSTRFTAVAKYAGRVWFSGMSSKKNGSKVFFSPVLQDIEDIGNFYQVGDPTSEFDPDLVASDGGVISIPSAYNIKALFEWGNKLLVFAENGVWEVAGPDGVFSATEFFVTRIRGAGGLVNIASLVDAEGTPMWWSNTGIFVVTSDEVSQATVGQDISRGTIQTFWDNIGAEFRSRAVGVYDGFTKQVFWLYGNDNTIDYKYNKVLILDTLLQAFVPWEFVDEATSTDYVVGASFFTGLGSTAIELDVVSSGGTDDVVSDSGTDDVIATVFQEKVDGPTQIRFLVRDGTTSKLTFATITNSDFKDWGTTDFSSFAETGYDFGGDLTTRKSNLFVTTYFNLTETGFTGDETNGYDFVNPSSCILKSFWDLQRNNASSQQAYRHLRPIIVDTGNLNSFDYPYETIITRNKIRGRGRTLRLRFESEAGKDFQLQGYEVINAKPR